MRIERPEDLMASGLLSGFAGKTSIEEERRKGIAIKSRHLHVTGGNYVDQWTTGRTGGGQELVQFRGKKLTRVYFGGTIPEENLAELGIQENDVMDYLKKVLTQARTRTRLYQPYSPTPEGNWVYKYEIIDNHPQISTTLARETIFYSEHFVFLHYIGICPVK